MIISALSLGQSTPFRQALVIGLVGAVAMVSSLFWSADPAKPWFLAGAFLGFYTWLNAVVGFFKRNRWILYVVKSYLSFAVLAGILYGLAQLIATTPIAKVPQYFTVLVATVVFELLAHAIVGIMRGIAEWIGVAHFAE